VSASRAATSRAGVVERLAALIDAVERPHPVRVAIDGPDAAGKTTLSDELAAAMRKEGRAVVRVSIDGFHRPREERYRRGPDSPVGYYEDSFDYGALRRCVLEPLGPGGTLRYRPAVFDLRTDSALPAAEAVAPRDAVLLLDGIFLLRPELFESWDVRIFVAVGFEEVLRRALERDATLLGSRAEVERRYRSRYIPGQQLYYAAARPAETAHLVVHNDDPERPTLDERL
jgi:uridine kinase